MGWSKQNTVYLVCSKLVYSNLPKVVQLHYSQEIQPLSAGTVSLAASQISAVLCKKHFFRVLVLNFCVCVILEGELPHYISISGLCKHLNLTYQSNE